MSSRPPHAPAGCLKVEDAAIVTHVELLLGAPHANVQGSVPRSPDVSGTLSIAAEPVPVFSEQLFQAGAFPAARTLDVRWAGGELDADTATLIARLFESMPLLAGWTLTNLATSVPSTSVLAALHQRSIQRGLTFATDFSLGPDADAFEVFDHRNARGGGSTGALQAVLIASREMRAEGVPVRWLVPLGRACAYRLEPLFSLARDEGVEPVLVPHWLAQPQFASSDAMLDDDERLFVRDFITYRLLDEERNLHSEARIGWYECLNATLASSGNVDAARDYRVAVVTHGEGDRGSAWTVRCESRPCHDGMPEELRMPQTSAPRSAGVEQRVAQARDLASVLTEGVRGLTQRLLAFAGPSACDPQGGEGARLDRVLLIGAYGGDHIGDTAILGGVLVRIQQRYGTTKAVLLSQRPEHTRHLVPMLDTSVAVDVDAYELDTIRKRLPQVDAVVFAGGPLIDLPKQLVKHFYTVALARRAGKPFIMEGIGPGPFARWPSEWTARRLVRMASRISVRTSTDAGSPLMKDMAPEIGHDPAFDYLATRGDVLTRLRPVDQAWIEKLLQGTEGRLRVGINLRPIRHLFTVGGPVGKRAEYTRQIEAQCEENLARGMLQFHRACAVPPRFVFFPMNAIQFGMSDLRSAYHVQRYLHPEVDFRVWQGDAGLDGVVALLRRLDIVITMRFHATIFALSQQRRVIGIDYRIGQRDKVGDLLADFDQSENCRRIDELDADWLAGRLGALAGALELPGATQRRTAG